MICYFQFSFLLFLSLRILDYILWFLKETKGNEQEKEISQY